MHALDGGALVLTKSALFNRINYHDRVQPAGQGNANAPGATAERTLSIDGTESLMMLAFCDRHNCTLEISLGQFWSKCIANMTAVACVCVCVGAFCTVNDERRSRLSFNLLSALSGPTTICIWLSGSLAAAVNVIGF